jgi:PIN domain nuclease of toxin-antitoxin system
VIVIDTHVWIWWVDDDPKLRPDVRDRIVTADGKILGYAGVRTVVAS